MCRWYLPANASMPGVDVWRCSIWGGVIVPRGLPMEGIGVLVALCILPLEYEVGPGDACAVGVGVIVCWRWWYPATGDGDEVIWLLRPDAVREGICRMARLPGDCIEADLVEGEGSAGGGGGVSLAGESCGDRRELMSIATGGRLDGWVPKVKLRRPGYQSKHSYTRELWNAVQMLLNDCACAATATIGVVVRK